MHVHVMTITIGTEKTILADVSKTLFNVFCSVAITSVLKQLQVLHVENNFNLIEAYFYAVFTLMCILKCFWYFFQKE